MKLTAKDVYESLENIERKLKESTRLFYCRFGDGEIYILDGGYTKDHKHNLKLTEAMHRVWQIQDNEFLKGVAVWYSKEPGMIRQVFAPFADTPKLEHILLQNGAKPGTVYENFIVFHYLSLFDPERMINFLDTYIRPKKKLFIGSSNPKAMEYVFGSIDYYVQTPDKNAFESIEDWYPKVLEHLNEVELVLPATGASTKVVMARLWELGYKGHCLDMGSVADVTQLRGTRGWIRLLGHRSQKILLPGWRESGLFPTKPLRNLKGEIKYNFKRIKEAITG